MGPLFLAFPFFFSYTTQFSIDMSDMKSSISDFEAQDVIIEGWHFYNRNSKYD